ncbi:unnamed protein product [Tuber melanosporum]|uniref:(Perigord truffle) hypothetical protein n=1 Tax=Tuber melanosporum (strain Mel28) TaxID=656061 RepID=D5G9S2_TUBMM|nr:uncharacterized protein GSTUM_00005048001 [Tuber melanosporum]CAZ81265.1 unnamed protein product [Tuber melanosporum]
MTHKSSHSMASHSARRPGTRTRPSSSPPPSPSTPPSNYSLSIQHAPSTQGYITSGPPFEISRTVNITVEVSSSSSTPAYNGYDVRNYPPVTTTCYSTEPSSPSASVSSYQYGMYESISSFPDYSNPPSSADTTAPPSSPFQGYTPSTSSAASTNYSYYASGGYAPEHCGSQSEYSGNQSQENQTTRRRQSTRSHRSTPHRG